MRKRDAGDCLTNEESIVMAEIEDLENNQNEMGNLLAEEEKE